MAAISCTRLALVSCEFSSLWYVSHAFGKDQGYRDNYGYHDLIMGRQAREEVWPGISEWLLRPN